MICWAHPLYAVNVKLKIEEWKGANIDLTLLTLQNHKKRMSGFSRGNQRFHLRFRSTSIDFHENWWIGGGYLKKQRWHSANLRFCPGAGCHPFSGVEIVLIKITQGIDRETNSKQNLLYKVFGINQYFPSYYCDFSW